MAAAFEKASRAIAARFSLGGRDANVIGRTDAHSEADTRGWLPGSSWGPGRQAIVFRFLSGPKRMLAGLARHFASDRARFLGSHRSLASTRDATKPS